LLPKAGRRDAPSARVLFISYRQRYHRSQGRLGGRRTPRSGRSRRERGALRPRAHARQEAAGAAAAERGAEDRRARSKPFWGRRGR